MAKQRPTDSGLPRRQPGRTLNDEAPVTPHPHTTPDGAEVHHRHKMGQLPHDHDDQGRPVLPGQTKMVPANADTLVFSTSDVLAAAPPSGAQVADPTHDTPDESGDASETGGEPSAPAGSGSGGSGRPSPAESVRRFGEAAAAGSRRSSLRVRTEGALVRPDASEKVLGAAMAVVNPT